MKELRSSGRTRTDRPIRITESSFREISRRIDLTLSCRQFATSSTVRRRSIPPRGSKGFIAYVLEWLAAAERETAAGVRGAGDRQWQTRAGVVSGLHPAPAQVSRAACLASRRTRTVSDGWSEATANARISASWMPPWRLPEAKHCLRCAFTPRVSVRDGSVTDRAVADSYGSTRGPPSLAIEMRMPRMISWALASASEGDAFRRRSAISLIID